MTEQNSGTTRTDVTPAYAISVAASITGLHPQTLRQYDRLGLVSPERASGRNRLYSERDIARLRVVADLSASGVNLAGVARILDLERELERLREFYADVMSSPSTAMVVWRPKRH